MSAIKATRIPQLVMESQEYVFVGQAVNMSKRILPAYSSKFIFIIEDFYRAMDNIISLNN